MSDAVQFPPGVLTGQPFTSVADAVAWMNAATEGGFGLPIGSFGYKIVFPPSPSSPPAGGPEFTSHVVVPHVPAPSPWPTVPATSVPWPSVLVNVDQGDVFEVHPDGARWPTSANLMSVHTGILIAAGGIVTGYLPAAGTIPDHGLGGGCALAGITPHYYATHLTVQSWHNACRRMFDAATSGKERTPLAPALGALEVAVADTGAAFLASANVWVSTVWADSINEGYTVTPADPAVPAPAHTRASTFTLHTA